jgi:protein phosphatase-4 regulatory subunit 3
LNGFGWGRGRGLNKDEERYFNEDGSDEDDQPTPLISSPSIVSSKASGSGPLKRKRSTGNGRAVGGSPQMTLPRTPPIGNLVGYGGDDDDDDEDGDSDLFGGTSHLPKRRLSVSSEEGDNASGPPATPRLSHRRIGSQSQTFLPLPSPDDDEDEEDNLLESLVTGSAIKLSSTPSTPSTTKSASSPTSSPDMGLMKMGEKRRRGDDDDDDEWMLARLATKAKRISNAVGISGENAEGGPKKIKLILNKLGSNLSTPSQAPTSGSDGG